MTEQGKTEVGVAFPFKAGRKRSRASRNLGLLLGSFAAAAKQLIALWRKGAFAAGSRPSPGFLRGIDFYGRVELFAVLRRATYRFHTVHGYYPDLLGPRFFAEKLFASKFLRPLKVPESGNKLLTASFIPPDLAGRLRCAEVVWSAPSASLPPDGAVPEGLYYLKASHGSGLYRRVHFPIDQACRSELEALCEKWLSTPFGRQSGEWWYNAFEKQIMLEKAVSKEEQTISFNVWTFGGTVALITIYRKHLTPDGEWQDSSIWVDDRFDPLPHQHPTRPLLTGWSVPEAAKSLIISFSRAIGRQFSFVRVDFLLDDEGYPHLGEITFAPGNVESRDSDRTAGNFVLWTAAEKTPRKYG